MGTHITRAMQTAYRIVKNLNNNCAASYSQEGEDMVLRRIFRDRREGYYVDVGAFHPQRFSNTYYFYNRGWNGINVDARPGSAAEFRRARPRDKNIEAAISDKREVLTYYMFSEPALNGFREDLSLLRDNPAAGWIVQSKRQIQTNTLAEVLDKHLPARQRIDFLSIDVEGLDRQVLASNDWDKYRPTIVLAEELGTLNLHELQNSPVCELLRSVQYMLIAKTVNTLFFVDRASPIPDNVDLHV